MNMGTQAASFNMPGKHQLTFRFDLRIIFWLVKSRWITFQKYVNVNQFLFYFSFYFYVTLCYSYQKVKNVMLHATDVNWNWGYISLVFTAMQCLKTAVQCTLYSTYFEYWAFTDFFLVMKSSFCSLCLLFSGILRCTVSLFAVDVNIDGSKIPCNSFEVFIRLCCLLLIRSSL